MRRSPKINLRTVRRVIRDKEVTGTSWHRCAVNIGGHLGSHPSCVSKIEDILVKLVNAGKVHMHDSTLLLGEDPRRSIAGKKKFDRAAARRQGRITQVIDPQRVTSTLEAWHECNPNEYASEVPPLGSAGGWDDDDVVFAYHCWMAERDARLRVLVMEQYLDWADAHGLTPVREPAYV